MGLYKFVINNNTLRQEFISEVGELSNNIDKNISLRAFKDKQLRLSIKYAMKDMYNLIINLNQNYTDTVKDIQNLESSVKDRYWKENERKIRNSPMYKDFLYVWESEYV